MNLFEATLDLASFAKGTEDYVISVVENPSRIKCNALSGRVAEFGGGTIWIRSGDCAGKFGRIKSSAAQTMDLEDTYTGLKAGDQITIGAWLEFDTQKLINAVQSVLRMYKIGEWIELEYDPDNPYINLEDCYGLLDIRQVLIANRYSGEPVTCHFWRYYPEFKMLQITDRNRLRYEAGAFMMALGTRMHGAVTKDQEIDPQVDHLYLRYMSWLYLCRNLIQNTHKDNLVSTDMYNEAKIYERDHGNLPNKALGMKTFTFPQW